MMMFATTHSSMSQRCNSFLPEVFVLTVLAVLMMVPTEVSSFGIRQNRHQHMVNHENQQATSRFTIFSSSRQRCSTSTSTTTLWMSSSEEEESPPATTGSSNTSSSASSSSNNQATIKCDIVIYGGGFGGLYTALALDKLCQQKGWTNWDIVIVDPNDEFVFLPLLYDLTIGTASQAEVCPTYTDLLKFSPNVRHISGGYSLQSFVKPTSTSTRGRGLPRPPPAILKNSKTGDSAILQSKAAVIAIGATPQTILSKIPGAIDYVQPFYTKHDAIATRKLLDHYETKLLSSKSSESSSTPIQIGIVGGGFGGVELAACIQRRLGSGPKNSDKRCQVTLISRTSRPMKDTRAESWIQSTLSKLGVQIQVGTVKEIQKLEDENDDDEPKYKVVFQEEEQEEEGSSDSNNNVYDAILWTAGSSPSSPISNYLSGGDEDDDDESSSLDDIFQKTKSGRLAVDESLRCRFATANDGAGTANSNNPSLPIWSLGDCAEIIVSSNEEVSSATAIPKTAQAAMQQADVVANNLFSYMTFASTTKTKSFQYQDLGSMFNLGGPNAAIMAPKEDSPLSSIFTPLLEVTDQTLRVADQVLEQTATNVINTKGGKEGSSSSYSSPSEFLGLSLSSHGLVGATTSSDDGENDGNSTTNGSLVGTVSGAARRAVYAARMPTPQQQAVSAASAFFSTANALAKEISTKTKQQQQEQQEQAQQQQSKSSSPQAQQKKSVQTSEKDD